MKRRLFRADAAKMLRQASNDELLERVQVSNRLRERGYKTQIPASNEDPDVGEDLRLTFDVAQTFIEIKWGPSNVVITCGIHEDPYIVAFDDRQLVNSAIIVKTVFEIIENT